VILPRANSCGSMLHLTTSDVLAMLSSTDGTPTGTANTSHAHTALMPSVNKQTDCNSQYYVYNKFCHWTA